MAWDGSGNFTRVHDWTDDENSAINIQASRMDAEDDNFRTGIEACLAKNGENTATQINCDNLRLDGNTISSRDTNGNIELSPNGTGIVRIDSVEVPTISSTHTLTNKTISGSTNTINNIDASNLSTGTVASARLPSGLLSTVYDADVELGNHFGTTNDARLVAIDLGSYYLCFLYIPSQTFSANSSPASTAGVIPATYRPDHNVFNAVAVGGSYAEHVAVSTAGTVNYHYRDWAGATYNAVASDATTVTWMSAV